MEKEKKQTFNTKVYECCADDKLRPIMQCVYFENGYAYASDGSVAIKQTLGFQSVIDITELDGKLLHKDNYRAVMNFEFAQATIDGIECWNANGQRAFFEYFKPADTDKIPNYEAVIKGKRGITSLSFIGINPESLNRVTKALYAPFGNLRIQFTGVDSAILVDVVGVDEQQAIIMPVILNDTLFK
jgi:hypothetical protein